MEKVGIVVLDEETGMKPDQKPAVPFVCGMGSQGLSKEDWATEWF